MTLIEENGTSNILIQISEFSETNSNRTKIKRVI